MTPQDYTIKLARLRTAMAEQDCDLVLLDSGESLAWISGYSVSETLWRAVFVPRAGDPWFVLRSLDAAPCREGGCISDVVGYPDTASGADVMVSELKRRGFGRARIGWDFNSVSCNPARLYAMQAALPEAVYIDLRGLTDSIRWVKTEGEIEALSAAARIADETMACLAAQLRPGRTTREMAALAASEFLLRGADTGETGPILRAEGDHEFLHGLFKGDRLEPGDILHAELIPYVNRYGARLMRPILTASPTLRQSEVAEGLITLQDQQIAAMRPGTPACDVDRILRDGVLKAGLRREYSNVTAYTLGLYSRTPRSSDFSRVFLPDQTWLLEENMVFHVYTTADGLGFSETVVVTPEGGRRLTQSPRQLSPPNT